MSSQQLQFYEQKIISDKEFPIEVNKNPMSANSRKTTAILKNLANLFIYNLTYLNYCLFCVK